MAACDQIDDARHWYAGRELKPRISESVRTLRERRSLPCRSLAPSRCSTPPRKRTDAPWRQFCASLEPQPHCRWKSDS